MWAHQNMTLRIPLLLLFSIVYLFFINNNLFNCSCNCICSNYNRIVFIVYSVSFIACVVLCTVFCLSVVCYFV
jgi:hypothetical protein